MRFPKLVIAVIASLIVVTMTWQYLLIPRMNFSVPKPFAGPNLYNPYESTTDSARWIRCNFHAHAHAWKGITNGHGTAQDIDTTYKILGYNVACVSNYHHINTQLRSAPGYVPAYEHGFNLKKTHQLVIGANKVVWADFVFPQDISSKQWLINQLNADTNTVVVINHPAVRNGYSIDDMSYLRGYHCMEVLSPSAQSFTHWDAALSGGCPIFLTANDDVHDIFEYQSSGKYCTWLQAAELSKDAVVKALRSGRSYGMKTGFIPDESRENRIKRLRDSMPSLLSLEVVSDSVSVVFSHEASEIVFTGQTGKELAVIKGRASAHYFIKPGDTYVRTSAHFKDGTEIYLNPVFRYEKEPFLITGIPTVNKGKTFLAGTFGSFLLSFWFLFIIQWVFDINWYQLLRRVQLPGGRKGRTQTPAFR